MLKLFRKRELKSPLLKNLLKKFLKFIVFSLDTGKKIVYNVYRKDSGGRRNVKKLYK